VRKGQAPRAARLLGTAEVVRETLGIELEPVERSMHDDATAQVQDLLSLSVLNAEWTAAREASRESAIAYALSPDDAFK
jgi:hypothetical protein